MRTRCIGWLVVTTVLFASCSGGRDTAGPESSAAATKPTKPPGTDPTESSTPESAGTSESPATSASETSAATTSSSSTTTTAAATTSTVAPTTTEAATTTTLPRTLQPVAGVHDPACVAQVLPGDSLSVIVDLAAREGVSVAGIQLENGIVNPNVIRAGDLLDICAGNGINDIDGAPRVATPAGPVSGSGVEAQQQQLNALFIGYGINQLPVDGVSARLTRQQLCAARVALGLPASRADMAPGGPEEVALMSARSVPIPPGAPTSAGRWALIDLTCQVIFIGESGNRVAFVFPTSTGSSGYETRRQSGSRVFRFDPALDNGGWHNSTAYPVPEDNPLNGNMYKPLYFDDGQAIHGANNVPTDPQSKGCARLRVGDQQSLVDWLGLGDAGGPTYDTGRIGLTVSVQGAY